jgi:hypothetical protein
LEAPLLRGSAAGRSGALNISDVALSAGLVFVESAFLDFVASAVSDLASAFLEESFLSASFFEALSGAFFSCLTSDFFSAFLVVLSAFADPSLSLTI